MGRALTRSLYSDTIRRLSTIARKVSRMAFSRLVFRWLWDFFLAYTVLTGWSISTFTACHISILCSWIVCLCDMVFLADSLAKLSRSVFQALHRLRPFACKRSKPKERPGKRESQLGILLRIASPVALVPYHFLFILELDGPGIYFMICLIRLMCLVQARGVAIAFLGKDTSKRTLRHAMKDNGVKSERSSN